MAAPVGIEKQDIRRAVAYEAGALILVTASANGASDGSTFVASQFNSSPASLGQDTLQANFVLNSDEAGTDANAGKYRPIVSASDTNPRTFTVSPVFTSQVVSGAILELHVHDPQTIHRAINNAIAEIRPWVYVGSLNASLTATANTEKYTLPAGVTPEMITLVEVEGTGDFDSQPYGTFPREAIDFSPDGLTMYLNRRMANQYIPETGLTIYLHVQNYLTALDEDTTYLQVTHDILVDNETGIQLTTNTGPYRLFILCCVANLFELLANAPMTRDRVAMRAQAKEARALYDFQKGRLAMPRMRRWELH